MNNSNKQIMFFQKSSYSDTNKSSFFLVVFLLMSKYQFKKLALDMGCFTLLLKLNGQFLEKQTRLQKRKRKQNNQYLNLKVSRHDQIIIFLFKTAGLKLILIQEKMIFTTYCFNNTLLEIYIFFFMFQLEVP